MLSSVASDPACSTRNDPLRRVRVAAWAVRTVIRLQTNKARTVQNLDELCESVANSPLVPGKPLLSSKHQAIGDHKRTEKLFCMLRRGTQQDAQDIESLILSSPSYYLRDSADPDSFVNKLNPQRVRPLHEAVRNSHVDLVQLLLNHGADPRLKIQVNSSQWENGLEVACRWNYLKIVKLLLASASWSQTELSRALKMSKHSQVRNELKKHLEGRTLFCRCLWW